MIYPNDSRGAGRAMEYMHTGHYGEDYPEPEPEYCPICYSETDEFYISEETGECVGCEFCISKSNTLR